MKNLCEIFHRPKYQQSDIFYKETDENSEEESSWVSIQHASWPSLHYLHFHTTDFVALIHSLLVTP